ncbi:MAG TPA: DUF4349 domain-containing protein [Chitinophagaceae bacterium]|nr:DUF4349 domain-containing protein [Chitinophagaceae bacterium]
MRDNIRKFGAYIAQEEQNQNDYKIENTVAIKVPVDQFDNLVTSLTKGEEKIIEKKITSEDATTDIVDTKSRLEAKKASATTLPGFTKTSEEYAGHPQRAK